MTYAIIYIVGFFVTAYLDGRYELSTNSDNAMPVVLFALTWPVGWALFLIITGLEKLYYLGRKGRKS
jgi:hypothetical protein